MGNGQLLAQSRSLGSRWTPKVQFQPIRRLALSSSQSSSRGRPLLGITLGTGSVLLLGWAGRRYLDHLWVHDLQAPVHSGNSSATIKTKRQLNDTDCIVLEYTGVDGEHSEVVVKKGELNSAVSGALELAAKSLREVASKSLEEELRICFDPIENRASTFADWYFAYPTSLQLLRKAASSAAKHSVDPARSVSLSTAISLDMDQLIMEKYQRIVLQPEINDTRMQTAFINAATQAHQSFCGILKDLDAKIVHNLAEHTTHLAKPRADAVHFRMDWPAQLHKIKAVSAQFEKMPEMSLVLGVGGGLAAKAATTAASGKLASAAAGKLCGGKLVAPFVKAASAGLLAGPAGAVAGGVAGVGLDMALSKGLELVQREDFEREVRRAVVATREEYFRVMEAELHRVVEVWVADAMAAARNQGA